MGGAAMVRTLRWPVFAAALSLPVVASVLGRHDDQLAPWQATRVAAGPFPKELQDVSGAGWRLERAPQRIVSVVLAADELLDGLVEHERLKGVTYLVDDPGTSVLAGRVPPQIVRVDGFLEPILALRPDLLIVAQYTDAATVAGASALGVPVVRLGLTASFRDVEQNLELLGAVTGNEAVARRRIATIGAHLARARARRPPRTVRVVVFGHGRAHGGDTLVDDVIRAAGARNAVAELGLSGSVALSLEALVELEPDVVLVPARVDDVRRGDPMILADPILQRLSAVRNGAVYQMPSAWIESLSDAALRAVDAVQSIAWERAT